MNRLVFWQNIASPHQAAFIRGLCELGYDVIYVCATDMSDDRRAFGWSVPDLGGCKLIVAPGEDRIRELAAASAKDTIHVMAGARWSALGERAIEALLIKGANVGVLSEAPDPRGIGGILRRAKYTLERMRRGRGYDFLLCMGEIGVDWFKSCGYDEGRLFPFCYVTENRVGAGAPTERGPFQFLFVGRLVKLKRVDVLLRALASVRDQDFHLRIIGDGEEGEALRHAAVQLDLSQRITWCGRMDADKVAEQMRSADALVLPSDKDGWGAVVNEALSVGTPVICSDACGAADLLVSPRLGRVFPKGDPVALAAQLGDVIRSGKTTEQNRLAIRQWSERIGGKSVAAYFRDVLEHVYQGAARPEPPWMSADF